MADARSRPKTDLREVAMETPEKLEPDTVDDGEGDAGRKRKPPARKPAPAARKLASAPGSFARSVTRRSGTYSGKGMLTAELLAGFVIILIRIVADFTVDDSTGTISSNVLHNADTYGPFPIAIGLIGVFFVLSFLAASGGNKAKLAVIFGGIVVLALGVKSVSEVEKIAGVIGNIGTYQVPQPTGNESSGASNPNTTVTLPGQSTGTGPIGSPNNPAPTPGGTLNPSTSPNVFTQVPDPTGNFPTINPGSPPANINGGPGDTYPSTPPSQIIRPGPPLQ